MKLKCILILIAQLFFYTSFSQILTDSNLPIVLINTDGGVIIPDNPRVMASMKIIFSGEGKRNRITDQDSSIFLNYNGRVNIEIRGSSSQFLQKKQYGFSTLKDDNISNNNVSLLGLPAENDWILSGLGFDPSLILDYLNYNLSRRIGQYASRTVYCEVVINGSYNGLYILQEKIKQGSDRVDVKKIASDDINFPEVTGGYITKADKITGGDPVAWTMPSYKSSQIVTFIHELPKPENVTTAQNSYIKTEFDKLSSTASIRNSTIESGYPSVIDILSFIDYMILNEYSANSDAYQYSTFYHKDRNGKLRAGPVWDTNLTFGNDLFLWGLNRSKYNTWQFANDDNTGPRFWKDLFDDSVFRCYLAKRFSELIQEGQPLNNSVVTSLIDSTVLTISEAALRENRRWGTVPDLAKEIIKIKGFIGQRITWMTSNLGSFSKCSNIEVPSLAITKIMYSPLTTPGYNSADDLEFIEITNTGHSDANLSGAYFAGTGFVYQFPVYSVIPAGFSIKLAGNAVVFRARYGSSPFGQFTRNLSDKGENLVLVDGYGNIIDNVRFSNKSPWPDADGNGKYIQLISLTSDNNTGSSWEATDATIVSTNDINAEESFRVYPSPVSEKLVVETTGVTYRLELLNLQGKVLQSTDVDTDQFIFDMSLYPQGVYLIKIVTDNRRFVKKIIKI